MIDFWHLAKTLETKTEEWEVSNMTVITDNKKRVTLHLAKPGERFEVYTAGDGKFVLTRVEAVQKSNPAKVRIVKRGTYSVGILDHPISEEAIREALNEFP